MLDTGDAPQTFERRGFIRYPRTLETLWQFLGLPPRDLAGGEVFDLSAAGVGLLVDRPFPEDTTLVLRLPSATLGWVSHLVRVKRCTEVGPNHYQVGCAFVKPLTL